MAVETDIVSLLLLCFWMLCPCISEKEILKIFQTSLKLEVK